MLKISSNNWLQRPSNKEFYEKNLKDYTEKLDKLDKEAKEKFNNILLKKTHRNQRRSCFKYFSKARRTKCLHLKSTRKKKVHRNKSRPWLKNFAKQKFHHSLLNQVSMTVQWRLFHKTQTSQSTHKSLLTQSLKREKKEGGKATTTVKYNMTRLLKVCLNVIKNVVLTWTGVFTLSSQIIGKIDSR